MIQHKANPRPPKLGSRSGSAVWYAREHELSEEAQGKLVALCELTDQRESAHMLRQVSLALGIFSHPAALQAVDNEPRPIEYAEAFERIKTRAVAMSSELESLPNRIREQLDVWLMAPDAPLVESEDRPTATESLHVLLQRFTGATQELGTLYRNETSRGRPRQNARRRLDFNLRAIFDRFYKGPETTPRPRGAIRFRSERHKRKDEFVKVALAEIGSPAER